MMEDAPPPPSPKEQIVVAVVIAGLSALATGLITWGVDELKQRFGSKPKEENKP